MPLYEYHCRSCGKDFEKMVRFSEADMLPDCPECRCRDTRKKISLFASQGSASSRGGLNASAGCAPSGRFT